METPRNGWHFSRFATSASRVAGKPATFGIALAVVLGWAACGPLFDFSNTWQLVINTGTTIVTFLMVFLIQSTQNRDAEAMHIKLDELIRTERGAQNALLDLEELDDEALERMHAQYAALAERARAMARGRIDAGLPAVGPRLPPR